MKFILYNAGCSLSLLLVLFLVFYPNLKVFRNNINDTVNDKL